MFDVRLNVHLSPSEEVGDNVSVGENLVVSSIEAALRRRRYSDLSMITIPEPLSGLVTTMSSRF